MFLSINLDRKIINSFPFETCESISHLFIDKREHSLKILNKYFTYRKIEFISRLSSTDNGLKDFILRYIAFHISKLPEPKSLWLHGIDKVKQTEYSDLWLSENFSTELVPKHVFMGTENIVLMCFCKLCFNWFETLINRIFYRKLNAKHIWINDFCLEFHSIHSNIISRE